MTNLGTSKYAVGLAGVIALIVGGVISVEGGYSDHPSDPGGKTMYGVTEATARAHGFTKPMEQLTQEEATAIYTSAYVVTPGFDKVIAISPNIGQEVVDSGVNVGPKRSSEWLQVALNSLNRNQKDYPNVTVDGKVGSATLSALQSLQKVRGKTGACKIMIKLLDAQQAAYYISLKHLKEFMIGWIDHRIGNVPLEKCNDDSIKTV